MTERLKSGGGGGGSDGSGGGDDGSGGGGSNVRIGVRDRKDRVMRQKQ